MERNAKTRRRERKRGRVFWNRFMRTRRRRRCGIAYQAQEEVAVFFESEELGVHRLDLVVELKAVKTLGNRSRAAAASPRTRRRESPFAPRE